MAEHDTAPEGEILDNLDLNTPEGDPPPEGGEAKSGAAEGDPPPEDEDELEITFGDDAPAQRGDNSDLVKHLRAEIKRRDEMLAARPAPNAPAPVDPGPKPTLEGCDYDGDKFEQELDAWKERSRKAEDAKSQAQKDNQAEAERFQDRLKVYGEGKAALKVKDFDVAETAVTSTLTPMQQAVALKAASDPAKVLYALGRYPQKLAEIAKLQDPIELAVAISKLEDKITVTQRTRTPPEPDTPPRGSGSFTPKADPTRERLEKEAARTGDRTAIVRYNREQREKEAARGRR